LHEDIVILWESVHIHTTPQLDIHANQVKASHGAAIHRIDGNNLFYLSSKWLSRSQAEKLLVDWYIDQICNTVDQDTQQTYKDTVHAVLYATTG
jgi:Fe-S cluster assembly protein SufD